MKAILLADERHRNFHVEEFFHVYSDEVLDSIQSLVDLAPAPVYLSRFEEKRDALRETEIIFSNWGMPELGMERVEEFFPRVKAVFYAGGDVRHFASPYFQMGARVFATGSANAVPAAEYTLAHILLAAKGAQRATRHYRDEATYRESRENTALRPGNFHVTVGIIGVGRVGRRVAELLRHFDATVYACDPFLTPDRARALGVQLMSMEEIFQQCDVVTCHLPVWSNLHNAVNEEMLSSMAENATFINASQGEVVDQEALVRVLRERPDLTAILDSTVPYALPGNHPLHRMDNVFLTPHIAGSFGGELERMGESIVAALRSYLAGEPSEHEMFRDIMQR